MHTVVKLDVIAPWTSFVIITLHICQGDFTMEKTEQENLDHLFTQLAQGETPTFLEMMAAISDVSNTYPEPEPVCDGQRCPNC